MCKCSHDSSPPRQAGNLEPAVGSTLWTSFVSMDPFRSYHMINRFEIASKEVLGIGIRSPRKWWANSPLFHSRDCLSMWVYLATLPCLASTPIASDVGSHGYCRSANDSFPCHFKAEIPKTVLTLRFCPGLLKVAGSLKSATGLPLWLFLGDPGWRLPDSYTRRYGRDA